MDVYIALIHAREDVTPHAHQLVKAAQQEAPPDAPIAIIHVREIVKAHAHQPVKEHLPEVLPDAAAAAVRAKAVVVQPVLLLVLMIAITGVRHIAQMIAPTTVREDAIHRVPVRATQLVQGPATERAMTHVGAHAILHVRGGQSNYRR